MKFSEAIEKIEGSQVVRNFITKIDDDEIFTSAEIIRKIGSRFQNQVRHTLANLADQKRIYKIKCGQKNFYAKKKSIAIKFADTIGGKIEN